jgi:hypothetical protein
MGHPEIQNQRPGHPPFLAREIGGTMLRIENTRAIKLAQLSFVLALVLRIATIPRGLEAQAPSPNGVTRAAFTLTINAVSNKLKTGTPVKLSVTVKNISNRDIQLYTDARGAEVEYTVDVRDEKGNVLPDTEYKRTNLSEDIPRLGGASMRPLRSGDSLTDMFNVSRLYEMVSPGRYTIQLQRFDLGSGTYVKSNTITVTVSP